MSKDKIKIMVSLNHNNVNEAKKLQKDLTGAENISGLIDKLLEQWIADTKYFNKILEKFKSKENKKQEEK